jgi:Zn-finger nucleic acid-binding protein
MCPACQEQMRPVELGEVSVDECRFCDGLWLDRDEPEQLAKMDVIGKHLLQPMTFDDSRKSIPEGERLCPRCGIRLDTHKHKGLTLDICGSCRGMFLDRWELQELFK